MTVIFHTLGCKVNQYETQAMRGLLDAAGFATGDYAALRGGDAQPAGELAFVVNSCTVTGESDRKLRQVLRRLRREYPGAALVLAGCMPQAFPDKATAIAEADIVIGNAARRRLPDLLREYRACPRRMVEIPPHDAAFEPLRIDAFEGRTRAFVKIEDGCNRFCTYCIVPHARGRVRSKPLADLRGELEELASNGYAEAVLVGINLTAYGTEAGGEIPGATDGPDAAGDALPLCDAVAAACGVEGLRRVRLGSLEPDTFNEATVARLAQYRDRLCPQFHLSLQSGCADTLRRMGRRYTPAEYLSVCEALRRRFPDCALTTDIMVGFPGETAEEFEQSLAFVRRAGFAGAHVFAYSPRPGTPAASADGQVPPEEKTRRSRRMTAACADSRDAYLSGMAGRIYEVLPEMRNDAGIWEGYTPQYIPVRFPGAAELAGRSVPVRVTGHENGVCRGEAADA